MGRYRYKARDKFGKLVQGIVEADSESALAVKLEKMEYIPILIKPKSGGSNARSFFDQLQVRRVKFSELNMFTRLLFTLQKAGLPMLTSLRAIYEQTSNQYFKEVIGEIATDIEGGTTLSAVLEKYPNIFNGLYTNMVKSGEISGRLPEVLDRLTVLGEHEETLRLRVKAAMRYPIIVVAVIVIAFLVLITFVVPRYEAMFSKFDTALPLPTQILLGLNYAVTKFWWLTIIVVGLSVFLFRKFIRTSKGKYWWGQLQLKLPVFGPLLLKLSMSRFCRITGTLLRSGVPILQILDLVSHSMSNVIISETIMDIKASVHDGKGMMDPMKMSGVFPPVVIQMVAAGEETGKLDELLTHVADYYDAQVDYTINNLVSLIEPLLIFVLGCAVLIMALGIFMPMWSMMKLFKH
ncbi:MAG: type II secretion system F family protein [Candidatus Omnitrophica bacterium]|nr:type II secretion system F family protein [Candidatus Omnitrophota bacterium]